MTNLCFDYGHGGGDPGAVYAGRKEAAEVLSLGREVAQEMRRQASALMRSEPGIPPSVLRREAILRIRGTMIALSPFTAMPTSRKKPAVLKRMSIPRRQKRPEAWLLRYKEPWWELDLTTGE